MNEEISILLAKDGNQSAFRDLYEGNCESVYRLAYRYTRSAQDAEDIMQETFIKAFQRIRRFTYREDSCFSAWLSRICVNCAIDHLRRCSKNNVNHRSSPAALGDALPSVGHNPAVSMESKQTGDLIQSSMSRLSPLQRVIFEMRYVEHRDIKEIAELMNRSQSTIKTQLSRSLAKLRKGLSALLEVE